MDGVLLICRVYLGRQCSELILSLQGAWRVTENAAQSTASFKWSSKLPDDGWLVQLERGKYGITASQTARRNQWLAPRAARATSACWGITVGILVLLRVIRCPTYTVGIWLVRGDFSFSYTVKAPHQSCQPLDPCRLLGGLPESSCLDCGRIDMPSLSLPSAGSLKIDCLRACKGGCMNTYFVNELMIRIESVLILDRWK
ncbi:uncharacterized protein BO96DRAFT_398225 [Aspergillus niger CBS 101883]|uniref:Uncharacterized protein n=2 Tax=Aspergillus niger TaxID=5061 RepID=A2R4Z8_ASPNC|nr:uncharacterized protein BO96DRAFT_398225 [Aspergillus niger CBS 101883]XP_059602464.1 hypothetical protein An15g02170 [Aspergillus niger]PYH54246.1 hypothetical protein BO96DRAFT_398225 [Aspergillus niger CBS 101883]CAK42320.1 hypothetical protein An15g02170 [Aspergillus niger]